MHKEGIVHFDLKPENIMWDETANELVVIDFGLARFCDGEPHPEGRGSDGNFESNF
jgi:serine/threonine protein kinase